MSEELQKHTLNLFAGDFAELQSLYPEAGASTVVRQIVRSFLEQVKAKGEAPENVEIEL